MGRFRHKHNLCLFTAAISGVKILKCSNEGDLMSFMNLFPLITSSVLTLLLRFSIVLPKTLLFINLKKVFSKSFAACLRLSVLEAMWSLSHGDCLKANPRGGGYYCQFRIGVCRQGSQTLTLIKKEENRELIPF